MKRRRTRRTPPVVLRARAAAAEVSEVPWLGNNGESYAEFCRRVERGWARAEAMRR